MPPAQAVVFEVATSDGLNARIELAYVPAAGGPVVPMTAAGNAGTVAAEPRWSPDGSRIAFVTSPRGHLTRYAGDGDIYAMNANGTHIRRLTTGLDASSPAWSPDGSQIAFVRNQGQELVVMRADGSAQHIIARARGYYESPAWSPDGQTIAYQSSPSHNIDVTAIFTIHPDGTHEHRLTPASVSATFPAWSPDGSQIAYSAGDQLWITHANGTGVRRLTNCRGQCVSDFSPAWSPTGADLAFVQQESGGIARRLYVLELATGAVRPLTPTTRWANSPDYRPG
jgi:TolB protein